MKEIIMKLKVATGIAQKLLEELNDSDPNNITLEQVGLLDGHETVLDFINVGEWQCALDHLLYMIHESDILYPREIMLELHQIAKSYNLNNHYSKENQVNLTQVQVASIFNAP